MSRDMFHQVRKTIRQRMTELDVPSVCAGVAQHGCIVWEEGFGWADRERRLAAHEHVAYPLASVTKPMTATAIMRLVELGKLDLDKPVNHYLSEQGQLKVWVGDPDSLTVRRLANHTAGLTTCVNMHLPDDRVPMPPQEELIRRYGHAVAMPGERYRYANFGYGILDHLVARVSGERFADFMHREVFVPLGMCRSAIGTPDRLATFTAARYDDDLQPIPDHPTSHAGASEGYASVHDLLRFGLFHLKRPLPDQQPILSSESLDAMHTPTASMSDVNPADLNLRPASQYGIGWVIDPVVTPRRISHGGGMGGSATKLLLLPDEEIVIAVVSNIFKPLAYQLEHDILEAMLPDYTRPSDAEPTSATHEPTAPDVSPLRGDWAGDIYTYQGTMPMTLRVTPNGDLHVKAGEHQQTTLVNGVRFEDGWLTGTFAGMIETDDANRRPRHPSHHLQLDLKHRDDRLTGAVLSIAGHTLGHWVDLRRSG